MDFFLETLGSRQLDCFCSSFLSYSEFPFNLKPNAPETHNQDDEKDKRGEGDDQFTLMMRAMKKIGTVKMLLMMMGMNVVMILDPVSGAAWKALLGGRGHQTILHSGSDALDDDDE